MVLIRVLLNGPIPRRIKIPGLVCTVIAIIYSLTYLSTVGLVWWQDIPVLCLYVVFVLFSAVCLIQTQPQRRIAFVFVIFAGIIGCYRMLSYHVLAKLYRSSEEAKRTFRCDAFAFPETVDSLNSSVAKLIWSGR